MTSKTMIEDDTGYLFRDLWKITVINAIRIDESIVLFPLPVLFEGPSTTPISWSRTHQEKIGLVSQ